MNVNGRLTAFMKVAAIALAPCAWTASAVAGSGDTSCLVTIDSGAVQGALVSQTCRYRGIPYAGSPAGGERWKPPEPATPWAGVFLANGGFGPMCPQLQGTAVVGAEDCLNLNIWAPTAGASPLPVILFLHGGGNRSGSGQGVGGESYDGQYLAENVQALAGSGQALVVTINYRLGALGWLAHSSLDAESENGTSGNYGILDQIAALKWVQRNIAAFGGDPSRVTVTGQSSGANDVGALFVSPLSKGLFANALIDGAGGLDDTLTLANYEAKIGNSIVNRLVLAGEGVSDSDCAAKCTAAQSGGDILACLRCIPASTIVQTVPGNTTAPPFGGLRERNAYNPPIVDGYVLKDTVLATASQGAQNHVPLIIGGTDKESSNPAFVPTDRTSPTACSDATAMTRTSCYIDNHEDYYRALVFRFCSDPSKPCDMADQVLALYPDYNYASPRLAFVAATTDSRWICPARRLARAVSNSQEEPVYRFLFTHALSNPVDATKLGAFHTEELLFTFHRWTYTQGVPGPFTPTTEELNLSDEMIGYWTRFAASGAKGNPNGGDAEHWVVYGKAGHFLQFDTPTLSGGADPQGVCEEFWDVTPAE